MYGHSHDTFGVSTIINIYSVVPTSPPLDYFTSMVGDLDTNQYQIDDSWVHRHLLN